MTDSLVIVDVQIALQDSSDIPNQADLQIWVEKTLQHVNYHTPHLPTELTIRFVENDEIHDLNLTYRGKDKATNVLSFPYEAMPGIELPLLGDIVISPAVMRAEAIAQGKEIQAHYAHLVTHGVLHLLGYDHINDDEANVMESLEVEILAKLGIDDPYQDKQ